jgi:Protein of unknown function (DUF3047)
VDSLIKILCRCLLAWFLVASFGCASFVEPPSQVNIEDNSVLSQIPPLTQRDGSTISSPWRAVSIPLKRRTEYRAVKYKGRNAIRANAKSSASAIEAKLNVNLKNTPAISFSWFAEALIKGADNTEKSAEDSPLRVMLSFEGDKDTLSGKEQRFHERAKLLTGRELPYATLMYIWENNKPVETVITNPHTTTIKKIVISSGAQDLGRWMTFKRNIADDYLLAFGKPAGKLIGIALMSDTDNTGTDITAYYGDLMLLDK